MNGKGKRDTEIFVAFAPNFTFLKKMKKNKNKGTQPRIGWLCTLLAQKTVFENKE